MFSQKDEMTIQKEQEDHMLVKSTITILEEHTKGITC